MLEILEYDCPDVAKFRDEIYPSPQPAILRGIGADLEPVQIAKRDEKEFGDYLKSQIGDRLTDVLVSKPDAGPTFFFDGSLSRLNFERGKMQFGKFVDAILGDMTNDRMIYIESTKVADLSPSLADALHLPFAPQDIPPKIWMGNKTGTHTHFDVQQNIAYVVSGRRRFTLFPPSQTPNLYMAPLEHSPSKAPVSMVQPEDPDLERFPHFQTAMKHALVAELGPGDAIFIPYMWWHHVKALGGFNVLVNYWWNEHEAMGAPLDAMLHALLVIRDLPPPMRDAWRTMFDTFVFKQHGEPMDYVETNEKGGLGPIDERMRMQMWQTLAAGLSEIMQKAFSPKYR